MNREYEFKGTPGAWEFTDLPLKLRSTDSAASIWGKYKDGGSPLVADISRSAGDEHAKHNAHLIAAAPDLLQACIATHRKINHILNQPLEQRSNVAIWDEYKALEAAIHKALNF